MFLLLSILVVMVANDNNGCGKGNQNPLPDPPHHNTPLGDANTSGRVSVDPNEIIGPVGYDSLRWVSVNDVLTYTILFENDPGFATANAQKVDVRFGFDDKQWMRGFGLGAFGFANRSWNIDNSQAAYQNRLDLRDSMNIYVDLNAGIDVVRRQAFWTFSSVDPETGVSPWQADRGMLPVNDSTHVGEGFVRFCLKPYEGLKTGDTISVAAGIVFDQNDTIRTNRWTNVIDAAAPVSRVKGRADSKSADLYHLTLEAADDRGGSGLKSVTLYLANSFGTYEEFAVCPVDTVIDFRAERGRQYRFYSLAEDNVGNREPLKDVPDFVINDNAAPTGIAMSDSTFCDDIAPQGFIAELTSVDSDGSTFTYALAEGEGAVHNDLFAVSGSRLMARGSFKCAADTVYRIRISTTDEGGLSFARPFVLHLRHVLERPLPDTLQVSICEGEAWPFHGIEYTKAGTYRYTQSNEFMCDSVYVLQLAVLPRLEAPKVTVEGVCTLVSSAERGNVWFRGDGTPVEGAVGQRFTPTEDGIYYVAVSNGACLSEPSQRFGVQVSDGCALRLALPEGWSWVSSNLADAGWQKAYDFVKPVERFVERLVGMDAELSRDPQQGLTGNLADMSPSAGYMLLANGAVDNTWNGHGYKPETTPVRLKKGWNWIGYLPVSALSLAEALSALSPDEGDIMKDYDGFAVYSGGKWEGTLATMAPGRGYMYWSARDKEFCYPVRRVFAVDDGTHVAVAQASVAPWHVASHKYAYNMNVIAAVHAGGSAMPAGVYTVGAFVDGECRGVGQYVGDRLYITLYGDAAVPSAVSFRAVDNATLAEYDIVETARFGNELLGSPASPFKLSVGGATGVGGLRDNAYNVYPNPVRDVLYVNGDLQRLRSVRVIAANGAVVAGTDSYTPDGLNVASLVDGAYVVVLGTDGGTVVKKIFKAKR